METTTAVFVVKQKACDTTWRYALIIICTTEVLNVTSFYA